MPKDLDFLAISMALGVLGLGCTSCISYAQTCAAMEHVRDSGKDATPVITECLENQGGEGALKLLPGKYQLLTPLVIKRSVTITTANVASEEICSKDTGEHCAVLAIGPIPPQSTIGVMPIEVAAKNVRFHSIAIIGPGNQDIAWQRRICLDQHARPLGGGVRVKADGFEMTNVLLKNASCYTAMEVIKGVGHTKFIGNTIGPNGNHKENQMWSDGITIHDGTGIVIESNIFRDNTDVQLVLGGCLNCNIHNNKFIHSNDFLRSSFAELMLHAWPGTSGNFSSSITSGNSIDCGQYRRCGYGLMIGGEPWYPSKAFGGTVRGNRIKNALLGLNVDKLTGTMDIKDNIILSSGGIANSDCGEKSWPAVNISPESQKFLVKKMPEYRSINTEKCLLNRR